MSGKRSCDECGATIYGRRDKRFCSDQCRTTNHNKTYAHSNTYMRKINTILKRNRKILAELNPKGKAKVMKDDLLLNGFNFYYFTNTYTTKTGKSYVFCYDQGYLDLGDGWYALVVKESYVR